jgi:hypothetical protein
MQQIKIINTIPNKTFVLVFIFWVKKKQIIKGMEKAMIPGYHSLGKRAIN